MNEFSLTAEQRDRLATRVADLYIQSMLFDMDIDWESLTLCEKNEYSEPVWLARWKEKVANGDAEANSPDQNLGENDHGR